MTDDNVLRFTAHNFALFCYDCSDVHVVYGRFAHDLWDEGTRAPVKTAGHADRYPNMKFGTYAAFEPPIEARWTANDGTTLSCEVDLNEVFPDRAVLHGADPRAIFTRLPISGRDPTLIVEINDRTISIYMDVFVQTVPAGTDVADSAVVSAREETRYRTLAFTRTL